MTLQEFSLLFMTLTPNKIEIIGCLDGNYEYFGDYNNLLNDMPYTILELKIKLIKYNFDSLEIFVEG